MKYLVNRVEFEYLLFLIILKNKRGFLVTNLINVLRLAAIVEGVSLLILLFIAMPLKYYFGNTEVVPVVGMTHGILFIVFVALSSFVCQQKDWSEKFFILVVLSSMVPFATFLMDRKLKSLN